MGGTRRTGKFVVALFDVQSIDLEDFFECLGIHNVAKATASEYRFSCPFPDHNNGDEKASAYMNEDTTSYFVTAAIHAGRPLDSLPLSWACHPLKPYECSRSVISPAA